MKKADVTKFIRGVQRTISKRSPEIFTAIGVASGVGAVILAVNATPKAMVLLEEAKQEKGEELTPVEKVKVAWKPYLPAVATEVFSIACIVGASSRHARRNAALATAYKLSETALAEYREKVVETVGEKKEKDIREKVAKTKVEKKPTNPQTVIVTSKGNTRFRDGAFGGEFTSDIEHIRRVINDLNRRMISEMYISVNEFYSEIGLRSVDMGDELGWNLDNGYIEVDFTPVLDDDGEVTIVMDYLVAPKYDFSKLM